MAFAGTPLFSLDGYLDENYKGQIDSLVIPDIDSALNLFEKAANIDDGNISYTSSDDKAIKENDASDLIECSNCHERFSKQSNFCPNCGSKRERPRPSFCDECGAPLNPNSKFCGECGKKIIV